VKSIFKKWDERQRFFLREFHNMESNFSFRSGDPIPRDFDRAEVDQTRGIPVLGTKSPPEGGDFDHVLAILE
jgi:hypothetical protein